MKTLIALACCFFVWSQAAWGHAVLVATSPAAGAVLTQAPQEITLKFNEPVEATSLRLFGPGERTLPVGIPAGDRDEVRLALPAGAADAGTYLLKWHVLSRDDHAVGGQLEYSIGVLSPLPAAALAGISLARDASIWLTRWLTYLCLFAVGGAALFRLRFRESEQSWARWPAWGGLVLLLMGLAQQGMELLDVPWTALWGWAPWKVALSSAYALALGFMALGLLAGLAALRARRSAPLLLWAVASALLPGVALAMGGHIMGPHGWMTRPLVALHVVAVMAWVGALVPLRGLLSPSMPAVSSASRGRPTRGGGQGLMNPSAWLLWVAAPVTVSGLVVGFLQLGRFSNLWQTDYGSVLLAAVVLAFVLVVVAVRNRQRLVASPQHGSDQERVRVRRGLGTEVILTIGLLGVVSLWHFAAPIHHQVALHEPHGPVVTLEDHAVRALVELPLLDAGPWRIEVISIDGAIFSPQRVVLTMSNPQAGIDPVEYQTLRQPDGRWRADLPALAPRGVWHMRVDVWASDFKEITLQRNLVLPDAPTSVETTH